MPEYTDWFDDDDDDDYVDIDPSEDYDSELLEAED